MDVFSTYQGQLFVWNAPKAAKNSLKHKISFDTAREIFFDRQATYFDASVPHETRMGLVGFSKSFKLLSVVHLNWEGDAIRIISARQPSKREIKLYENGI